MTTILESLKKDLRKFERLEKAKFLKTHYKKMPRTMLRYAIEKFPEGTRKRYLDSKI